MYVYVGLIASVVVVSCVEALTYSMFTSLAARNLHNKMFNIVLKAPMTFFERRPVGNNYFDYYIDHLRHVKCWILLVLGEVLWYTNSRLLV